MLSELSEQFLSLIWFEVCIYDHWVGFVLSKEFISKGGWQWFELNFGRFGQGVSWNGQRISYNICILALQRGCAGLGTDRGGRTICWLVAPFSK